ncbi:restriction endonuclease subunit S [Plantactinospora siamensis]|uniref:Restriction endonuclease subunit S n=1 Tax=Plantactinospora siamensis TaxID=555372 RepID=A0ABV6P3R1_9ACTN
MTWAQTRLKDLCVDAGQYGLNISADSYVETGTRLIRTSDIEQDGSLRSAGVYVNLPLEPRHTLQYGDLLLSRSGTLGRSFLTPAAAERATFAGYLVRFRPRQDVEPRFLAYAAASLPFQDAVRADAVTSTIQNFNAERYANIPLPSPSLGAQRRIADFLDAELGRLRKISERRTRQIKALLERELAAIAAALSGSDNATAERRDTGWSWLPSIPADWATGPVYAYFDVLLGKMLNPERAAGRHPRPYLRNANVHWYQVNVDDLAEMSFEPEERPRYLVRKGDLLVCEGGAGVAEAAVWDGSVEECYYQKSLHRVRPRQHVPVEWLMYWLRLAKEVGVFASGGNLATIPHLTGEQLREHRIPIPPDGSWRVARLTEEVQSVHRLVASLRSGNSLLLERQQALITAAVTGQIDVTTARGVAV